MHLDAAEFGELCGDEVGGAAFLEAEFGMRVDVAPDAGQLVVEPGNGFENRHASLPPQRANPLRLRGAEEGVVAGRQSRRPPPHPPSPQWERELR